MNIAWEKYAVPMPPYSLLVLAACSLAQLPSFRAWQLFTIPYIHIYMNFIVLRFYAAAFPRIFPLAVEAF